MLQRLFTALLLFALATNARAAERNVIFIITDDESPTLGCYGDPVAVTPNIDAIAADGTLFRNAFATTASCSASRSVVMSGLHNHRNGQYGHQHAYHKFASWHNVVSLSLPRVMANAGYRTGQCGKYHVAPEEVYRYENYIKGNGRNAVEMANSCEEFIRDSSSDKPFFLYFATSDPHRGGGTDQNSERELKPNLFGNKPNDGSFPGVKEVFYKPENVPIPHFLPDTPETREELAQYYQSCSRIDQGVGRLVEILKKADLYDKTLIVFTSDHGMAFAGGKTTVYEGGLKVPFVVRNPYEKNRGLESEALISHIDITPSLLDFGGGLDPKINGPKNWVNPNDYWKGNKNVAKDNRGGGSFRSYQGKSWIPILGDPDATHWDTIFASHTFHEIQMYYPMRVVRDKQYKLIWNIAHQLPYPFASDLWAASSWQAQFKDSMDAPYGQKSVGEYINRPKFELYDIQADPFEKRNLAVEREFNDVLTAYQEKLKALQKKMGDPWIMKWDYE
ncbi:sulfatase family protein [Fuerstiella marisgermanici]|uniref:Arylsulfatase n=1 Tax=Fuerstiella marisgermanici TaxID=1891926 RepID=A0A1P8WD72_9PLAN|nr:sulfatase [Fuerstiella marisgermanici]APZ92025.1 Arylsulfatase [Fuerstiella marisgermanici]